MRNWLVLITVFLPVLLVSCSGESGKEGDYLVRVNDYRISQGDVDALLKLEAELDSNFYVSQDTRGEFIRDLIETQLLIQEAKKLKLDSREQFRQTIQRYWESTLIRDLIAEKSQKIRATTVVSREEIEAYYQEHQASLGGSLDELAAELASQIEERKVTAAIAAWITELRDQANIEIRDPQLAAKLEEQSN
jgi:hypothetical protein